MNFPLRKNDLGADVKKLQQLIGAKVDGDFGGLTEAALRQAQFARGLKVTGIVADQAGWNALLIAPPAALWTFTAEFMAKGFPRCLDPAAWADAFNLAFARFPAFNLNGVACCLAKANTEAGGLTRWEEDLNYSSLQRLLDTFDDAKLGPDPSALLNNPVALGKAVYGSYDNRGSGAMQLTGADVQGNFAKDMGMTLPKARTYARTIPGAAMTVPWYLDRYGATAAANRGDMKEVLRVVAGKRDMAALMKIWVVIGGERQMADFNRYRVLLATLPAAT